MTRRRAVIGVILVACTAGSARAESGRWETALVLYQSRQFSAARRLFEATLQNSPKWQTDYYLGRIATWFNNEDEAQRRLEHAAAAAPNDAGIANALGDLYGLRAQTATLLAKPRWACKCRAAYVRAIELAPSEVRYHWSLLGFCLIAPSIVGGGIDAAREQATAIAKLDAAEGRIAVATIALHTGHPADAFRVFDAVLQHSPDDYLALYHVGRCAAVSGLQCERGLAALRRCLTLPLPAQRDAPTAANIHQRIGDILAYEGDTVASNAEYAQVHQLEPDFAPQKMMLRY